MGKLEEGHQAESGTFVLLFAVVLFFREMSPVSPFTEPLTWIPTSIVFSFSGSTSVAFHNLMCISMKTSRH
jgi:hypothetical protein